MDIVLFSVQVGQPRLVPDREPWLTAFYKTPVEGPVHLGRDNLAGDRQADLTVHGGPDKAVCVYSGDHYATWRGELAEPACGPGWFGENFTVAKQAERTVCIGDVYQVGSAVVEVSQPRSPCWKLAKRWGRLDLPKLVVRSGRSGWYLRVLEEGMIAAGQILSLLRRPHPEWTVERVNHLMYVRGTAASKARGDRLRLAACAQLSEGWRTAFLEAAL